MTWPTDCLAIDKMCPAPEWDTGNLVTAACLIEATAPKLGNVHPQASFSDMSYQDFEKSSRVIGPVFAEACSRSVGQLVLDSVRATQTVTRVNTNLGTLLLLAPLVKACVVGESSEVRGPLELSIAKILSGLSEQDSADVYAAIRLANPGGIGQVDDMDVSDTAPPSLMHAMHDAKYRDMIAWEYTNRFERVRCLADLLLARRVEVSVLAPFWFEAVCEAQLNALSRWGDSLIARKNGQAMSDEVQRLAGEVLSGRLPAQELDTFLRADGHRRNPGSTADLLAAAIFLTLWRLNTSFKNRD